MNYEGKEDDTQEHRVVEEVLKDINFLVLKLTGVDLIEDLEEHEHMEEYGVVLSCLNGPFLDTDGRRNIENVGAYIK